MLKVIVLFALVALSCALLVERAAVDPEDPEVLTAANVVTEALSKQFSGKHHHRLGRVLKARKEESNGGATFQMDIVVGETECKRDEYTFEEAASCDFRHHQSTFKKCITTVFRDNDGSHRVGPKGCILATKKESEGL